MGTLRDIKPALPSHWYYDSERYRRELEAIWYQDWVCVGREEDIAKPGNFIVAGIGDQRIIVTRNADGDLRAFHNTCRHRGAELCNTDKGRFRNGRIICPYHTWTYSTDGDLLATPRRIDSSGFDLADYSLHDVHITTWRKFVFISLAEQPASDVEPFLGGEARNLANWPLETLRRAHQETSRLACNWKIFWENYSECYHCPRVHPDLCRLVPVYGEAVTSYAGLPGWEPSQPDDTGAPRVRDGARTWTPDGQSSLPTMAGPTAEEIDRGVAFASFTASMYIVAHPDYVRTVRIVPTGPESTELVVDWLLPETTRLAGPDDLLPILELARTVIREDGEACELNQRGLRSRRFAAGVLVGQEYDLWTFHEWLRSRVAD